MAACLEPKFTAADPSFPTFLDSEGHVICLTPDRYDDLSFVLGGAYVEMGADGEPMDDVWKGSASDFVRAEGYVAAKEWSKTEIETNSSRVFYSPAKSRRFAMKARLRRPAACQPRAPARRRIAHTCACAREPADVHPSSKLFACGH